jgi:hypothetical protein
MSVSIEQRSSPSPSKRVHERRGGHEGGGGTVGPTMKRVRECGGLRVLHLEGCHLRSASSRSARSDAARFDELDTSSRALKNVLTRSGLRGRSPTPAAIAQGWVVREESTKTTKKNGPR